MDMEPAIGGNFPPNMGLDRGYPTPPPHQTGGSPTLDMGLNRGVLSPPDMGPGRGLTTPPLPNWTWDRTRGSTPTGHVTGQGVAPPPHHPDVN